MVADRGAAHGRRLPRAQFPAGLQAVMDRALARDSGRRYRSVSEFGQAVSRRWEMPLGADQRSRRPARSRTVPQAVLGADSRLPGGRPSPSASPRWQSRAAA
jgi:hypothetical protein